MKNLRHRNDVRKIYYLLLCAHLYMCMSKVRRRVLCSRESRTNENKMLAGVNYYNTGEQRTYYLPIIKYII